MPLKSAFLLAALLLAPFAAVAADESVPGASLQPGQVFRDCVTCPEMVVLPAGEFEMGGDEEDVPHVVPRHQETIAKPFAIGKFEVTLELFARFVRETYYQAEIHCHLEGYDTAYDDLHSWKMPGFELYDPSFWQQPGHPVVCVSHDDAVALADWLSQKTGQSYRLPSEAEWEYAYRAGTTGTYYWGEEPDRAYANYHGAATFLERISADTFTMPVGRFPANGFGLHDMAGNVAEWVEECQSGYEVRCFQWVARGGGWYLGQEDLQGHWRMSPGGTGPYPPTASNDIGFRLVRDLLPREKPSRDDTATAPGESDVTSPTPATESDELAGQQSEARLKNAYEALMRKVPAESVHPLSEAQRAWVAYRDAHCTYQVRSSAAVCVAEMNLERAAQFEDAVRLRVAKKDEREQTDWKRGKLGHLSQFAGTYRYDAILDDPAVAQALLDLAGKDAVRTIRSDMQVISPILLDGCDLILRGNDAYPKTDERALVYIDIYHGTVRAALIQDEEPAVYARENEYRYIPEGLRNFVCSSELLKDCRKASSGEAPPNGVRWVR